MLLTIYLLSSVANVPILEPSLWLSMDFSYFSIHFDKLFSLHSGFYDFYEITPDPYLIAHKSCHFLFFGTLSLLFLWNLNNNKYRYTLSWLFTTIYGLIDELHQFATPGRTGTIQDVAVDSLSAFIWLSTFFYLTAAYKNISQKKFLLRHLNN